MLKSGNKKVFTSHFVPETEIIQYTAKMVRFKTEITIKNRCDLEQKKKYCDSWINHTAESQSDFREHQRFQNGYKTECHIPTRVSHDKSSDLREDLKLVTY